MKWRFDWLYTPAVLAVGACAAFSFPAPALADRAAPAPIVVPGAAGSFDWMTADPDKHRILASHPGAKSIAVLDLTTGKIQSLDCGVECNGIAVDTADNKYFFGGGGQKIEIFDRDSLSKTGEIPLTGPADQVLYDPDNDTVYADHDDGTEVWTIDAKATKITGSVTIGEAPEYAEYDATNHMLYQNIKSANTLQVIDTTTNKVVATWPTDPATSPHGLALVPKRNWVLTAGKNGKLVAIDMTTGKAAFTADIKPGVDQIAYDPKARRAYCACKGFISVVQVKKTGLTNIGDIPVNTTAHTLAIDPDSGDVWYSYSDSQNSYLAELPALPTQTAAAPASN
ncbi:MAG TPA: YncE family protein [Capsulimonadaceae bacterium]|nr:YncE family protein [Capsulimonadaceae bacterium]